MQDWIAVCIIKSGFSFFHSQAYLISRLGSQITWHLWWKFEVLLKLNLPKNIGFFVLKHSGWEILIMKISSNQVRIFFFWGTPMFKLTQKIKAIRMALLQWGGGNARSLIKSIEVKRYLLAILETECQAKPSNQLLPQRRNSTRAELNELIAQENIYWHQRAKVS